MLRQLLAFDSTFTVHHASSAVAGPEQLDLFGESDIVGAQGELPGLPVPAAPMLRGELIGLINPLATVVGFTDLLLDEKLDDEQARLARAANEAGREIERRVRKVLARLDETRREVAMRGPSDFELEAELDRLSVAPSLQRLR